MSSPDNDCHASKIQRSISTASRTSTLDISGRGTTRGGSNHHFPKAPLKQGTLVPKTCVLLKGEGTQMRDFFVNKRGVLFGGPGAFTPVCSERHMIGFRDYAAQIREANIDFIGSIYINDPYVLKAWARCKKVQDQFTFISDVEGRLTSALGLMSPIKSKGLGPRGRRFAMVIGYGGVIEWISVDENCYAEDVLNFLGVEPKRDVDLSPVETPQAKEGLSPWAITTTTAESEPLLTSAQSLYSEGGCGSVHESLYEDHDGTQINSDDAETTDENGDFTEAQLTSQEINIAMLRSFIIEASVRNDKLSGRNFATIALGQGYKEDNTFSIDYFARPGVYTSWYLPRNLRLTVNLAHWSSGLGSLTYNGHEYIAMGFHIVGPSPHQLDEQPDFARCAELRIFHVPVAKNPHDKCRMLVLAITFNPPPLMASERDNLLAVNPLINQILDVPTLASDTFEAFQFGSSALNGGKFDLECLFESPDAAFIKYEGVLSALGERVTWIIRKDPLSISRDQQVKLEDYLYIMSSVSIPDPLTCLKLSRVVRYLPRFSNVKAQSGRVIVEALRKKLYAVMYLMYVILRSSYTGLQKEEEFSFWIHVLREHFSEQRTENEDFLNTLRRASIVYPPTAELMKNLANLPLRDTEFLQRFLSKEDCVRVIDSLKSVSSASSSPHTLLKKGVTLGRSSFLPANDTDEESLHKRSECDSPSRALSLNNDNTEAPVDDAQTYPNSIKRAGSDLSPPVGKHYFNSGMSEQRSSIITSPKENWSGPFWAASSVIDSPTCPTSPVRQPCNMSPETGPGESIEHAENTPQPKKGGTAGEASGSENESTPKPLMKSSFKSKEEFLEDIADRRAFSDSDHGDGDNDDDDGDPNSVDQRMDRNQLRPSDSDLSGTFNSSSDEETSEVANGMTSPPDRYSSSSDRQGSSAESSSEDDHGKELLLSRKRKEYSASSDSVVLRMKAVEKDSQKAAGLVRSAMKGSRQKYLEERGESCGRSHGMNQDRLDLVEFMVKQLAKNHKEDITDEVTLANTTTNSVARRMTRKELNRISEAERKMDSSQSRSRREIRFARKHEEYARESSDPWKTYDRQMSRELRLRGRKATGHPLGINGSNSAPLEALRREVRKTSREEQTGYAKQSKKNNKQFSSSATNGKRRVTVAHHAKDRTSTTTSGEDSSSGDESHFHEETSSSVSCGSDNNMMTEDYNHQEKRFRHGGVVTCSDSSSDEECENYRRETRRTKDAKNDSQYRSGSALSSFSHPQQHEYSRLSASESSSVSSDHRNNNARHSSGRRRSAPTPSPPSSSGKQRQSKVNSTSDVAEDYVYKGKMSSGVDIEMRLRYECREKRWYCHMTLGLQKAKLSMTDMKEMIQMMSRQKRGVTQNDLELKKVLEKTIGMLKRLKTSITA